MRVIREIDLDGKPVQVKELTVGEIRAWLKDAAAPGGDLIDATLFEEFAISDILRMTDIGTGDIDALTPAAIRRVADVAREVNADFFAMRNRLADLGRKAVAGG